MIKQSNGSQHAYNTVKCCVCCSTWPRDWFYVLTFQYSWLCMQTGSSRSPPSKRHGTSYANTRRCQSPILTHTYAEYHTMLPRCCGYTKIPHCSLPFVTTVVLYIIRFSFHLLSASFVFPLIFSFLSFCPLSFTHILACLVLASPSIFHAYRLTRRQLPRLFSFLSVLLALSCI